MKATRSEFVEFYDYYRSLDDVDSPREIDIKDCLEETELNEEVILDIMANYDEYKFEYLS